MIHIFTVLAAYRGSPLPWKPRPIRFRPPWSKPSYRTSDPEIDKLKWEQERALMESNPARLAFLARRREANLRSIEIRRAERVERNGGVPPSGPLVCPICLYPRQPEDPGLLSICPECAFRYSDSPSKLSKAANSTSSRTNITLTLVVVLIIILIVGLAHAAATPNPSRKRSANGRPPGPGRWYSAHFHRPGPGVLPSSPA